MWETEWKGKEAPCKCWREGGRWDESHSPLPRNDRLRDSAPGGQAPPALGHTSVAPAPTGALDGQDRRPRIRARPPPRPRPPGGLRRRRSQPLLTWGPRAGRGWGARAPGGEGRRGQGKPPAWRARGAPPPGRTQQAEAQEQGPATRAGLGARRGLCAAAWGWTWVTCGGDSARREDKEGREMSGPAHPRPRPRPARPRPCAQAPPRPPAASARGKPRPAQSPAPL